MPKILLTQAQRDANTVRKWETKFRATALYRMTLMNMHLADVAKRLSVPRSTMYDRMRNPQHMPLDEVLRIINLLRFTNAERGELFGYALDTLKPASNE